MIKFDVVEKESRKEPVYDVNQKWAILSVHDKTGIEDFAQVLVKNGYKIISSAGTADKLRQAEIKVTDVSELVGGDPILGDKVKTLSREVAAGLLVRRDVLHEIEEMKSLGLPIIDLVCVDMYPLEETIKKNPENLEEVLKSTDIGGPTMLREGAKGKKPTIVKPEQMEEFIDWLESDQPNPEEFINRLNAEAEYEVSRYSGMSGKYRSEGNNIVIPLTNRQKLSYGSNPETEASIYRTDMDRISPPDPLAYYNFKLITGKDRGANNFDDGDKALQVITHLAAVMDVNFNDHNQPMMIGLKHGNACGAAIDNDPITVTKRMIEGSPKSIFGGIVMSNFKIDEEVAEILLTHQVSSKRVLDNIYAPEFTQDAIDMLKRKTDRCRFLENPALSTLDRNSLDQKPRIMSIRGGMIIQGNFTYILDLAHPELKVYGGKLTENIKKQIALAWAIGSMSSSNTITIVKDGYLLGNGVGQQDRVGCAELAIERAEKSHHDLSGSIAYSDSFFPFPDGILTLIDKGVKVVFASSGSVNDDLVIKTAQDNGILLVMLPDKICRGFRP